MRGLHFQWEPPMGKLMRVTHGRHFWWRWTFAKDRQLWASGSAWKLRRRTAASLGSGGVCARLLRALRISPRFSTNAPAFTTTRPSLEFFGTIPKIGIEWPLTEVVQLSEKDQKAQTLQQWLATPESDNFRYSMTEQQVQRNGGNDEILDCRRSGLRGIVLIPKLLDRGYKVDVVDLFWFGNHLPRQAGVLNKDIFHLSVEDLEPYDQVIFLAGLSNDPMAEFSPSKNFIFNAAAPAYLAYMAKNRQGEEIYLCLVLLGLRLHRKRAVR